MKSKMWFLVSLAIVASMLLAACGSPSAAPSSSGGESGTSSEPVTIRFFHKWPEPEHTDFYNYVIQEYQKTHPNVKIAMEFVADEPYKDKIRVLMASGEVPDIYFSWAGARSHRRVDEQRLER